MHPLARHWARFTWLSALLLPLAVVFAAAAWMRRAAFRAGLLRAQRVGAAVVVIGNITAGGTGKTPLAIALAEALRAAGFQPGIVSRGYGGRARIMEVTPGTDPALAGDEPVLMARRARCPVWVGTDRVAAARALLRRYPGCDVLLSDDGLQHYRLARDVELAVVDADRGFGNRLPLPAGPLREPVCRLSRVDAVVLHGEGDPALPAVTRFRMRLQGVRFHRLSDPSEQVDAGYFAGASAHAVAGIGNPARFFAHLRALGMVFTGHAFADHHRFRPADFEAFADDPVIMTEKDAIKCGAFARANWWVLPVRATLDPALAELITAKLYALHGR